MKAEEFLKNSEKYKDDKLFLIYGEQELLKDECKKKIEEMFSLDELSCTVFEEKYTAADVISVAQSLSFFSPYSCAFVLTLPDAQTTDRLLSFFDKMPDYSRVIFMINGEIDKRRALIKYIIKNGVEICAEAQTEAWEFVLREAKRNRLSLKENDAKYICEIAGSDMYTLKNEVNKLANLGKTEILRSDIDEIVSKSEDYNIFLLNTLMIKGDFERGIKLALDIKAKEGSYIGLIALLSNRFYQMYLAKCCLERGLSVSAAAEELSKTAHMNKYAAKYAAEDAKKLSLIKLKEGIELLAEYDAVLKTGGVNKGIEYVLTKLYS